MSTALTELIDSKTMINLRGKLILEMVQIYQYKPLEGSWHLDTPLPRVNRTARGFSAIEKGCF